MGLGDPELLDDGDGGGKTVSVSCSICLEVVTDNGDRSWAKLQCGHQFHLDCIGSAFNIKGAMQCPNCRKIEKGQWLYANGNRPYTEFNFEDWAQDEDLYDLTYSEMSFGVHWCPFSGLRLPSSFDEGDFSSSAYHDLLGQHAIFAEHTAVSSASHHCPYVAYFGPIPPLSSNSSGNVSDGSNFNNSHWNNQPAPSEIPPSSYAFPSMDAHYHHTWDQHSSLFPTASSRVAGPDQHSIPSMTQRTARTSSDLPRSGSFVHPFLLGHGSNARAGSSVASSMIPPYPGSAARARDRVQALQAYFQHPPSNSPAMRTTAMPGPRRTGGHRSMAQPGPAASSSDHQAGSFYYLPSGSATERNFSEAENPSRFHTWEREHFPSFLLNQDRDQIWGPVHPQLAGGSTSFRQRHGSERNPSQHW